MREFLKEEQTSVNLIPVVDLDNQIMSGTRSALYINDGHIIGEEE